ncbi:MAG: DUF1302 domain-containing protein [Candidatus Thiodiazotropha sp. (ex Ustalcina ferruginea)]|nr:DUF1302 domain-containing protein [Candidatus Thiodiazotropha sp. (ex Ustalcina ferruginea)]
MLKAEYVFRRPPLPLAVIVGAMLMTQTPSAAAFELNFGEDAEMSGNLDMTLGYAASWRTQDADRSDLTPGFLARGLNYTADARDPDAGDRLTNIAKATAELDLDWRNYGLVASASYQYDHEVMRSGNAVDIFTGEPRDSSEAAEDYAGNFLDVLDAYVFGTFDVGENANPLEVRIGKQVINWGEGLFFVNGVATQVPLNFNKLTTPGSELKEAYIGNEAVYAQLGIGDESALEVYSQWRWNRTELPPMDTFFGSEALGRGGDELTSFGIPARPSDIEADDSGQWGLAFRTNVGNIEYGLFYSRYHETLPTLAVDQSDPFNCDIGDGNGPVSPCNSVFGLRQIWAEDQDMFGVSASGTLGLWSINAELAYRPDQALWGDLLVKGYTNLNPGADFLTNIERHDTMHASVHGVWLGRGIDALGIDNQVGLLQFGVDYIDGDLGNLAAHSTITRNEDLTTLDPDSTAYGIGGEWIATWNQALPGVDLELDVYLQHDIKGNSHYWGNFAEGRTLGSLGLDAIIRQDLVVGLTYAWINQGNSDYEDQDTVNLSVNYKF